MPTIAELTSDSSKRVNFSEPSGLSWKKQLANATTSARSLLQRLELSHHLEASDIDPAFTCLATDSYISKIKPGDINDPLLKQILPLVIEKDSGVQQHAKSDPVGDMDAQVSQGLLHKYHGRALLISTGACAIHCRYCFRREFPYQQSSCTSNSIEKMTEYLHRHDEIDEVILSGGDPLILDNNKLGRLIYQLESINHLKTLRIHSRLPVVLAERIDDGLCQLLASTRFQVVLVIHSNHPNELQKTESDRLHRLSAAGITLLNQSVLLKGINDNADILSNLSRRLFECKTLPYYLHLLDPVNGTMHFEVNKSDALMIHDEITSQLPGYLVPRLVQEVAGNKAKTAIFRI